MNMERRTIRASGAAILCALLVRLLCGCVPGQIVRFLGKPEVASVLFYLETGRIVRVPEPTVPSPPDPTEPTAAPTDAPETDPPATEPDALPVFAPTDVETVRFCGNYDNTPDIAALVQRPLRWDLTEDGPAVLIVHTHATESYVNHEGYKESSAYRTLDENYNMVSVGDRIAEVLEAGGISVLHDRTLHDHPSYTDSYNHCRQSIAAYLEQYPSIRMVLDIHRDAVEDSDGNEMAFRVQAGEQTAAQIMLVVGTDGNGLSHPGWEGNLAVALKLYAGLERLCPGINRPISLRRERFNQDMTSGSLLVEMGAAGNTRQEALLAGEYLAKSILAVAHGANPGGE